jgi:hypothetical protein
MRLWQSSITLRQEYEARIAQDEENISALRLEAEQLRGDELQWARRHLLQVEKDQVMGAFHHGALSQGIYERLLADIDARLLQLESGDDRGQVWG